MKKEREYIIHKKGVIGAPDLIIEILSTNKTHDQERNLELYQRNGVPEYIIIDPETKQLWQYLLQNQLYVPQPVTGNGQLLISQLNFTIAF